MDPEAKLPYCDQNSMMALVNNQDDPRMKPLHGQTEFTYCLLWTDDNTIHNSSWTDACCSGQFP